MASATSARSDHLLETLHALSDRNRLAVLDALREGERCVCDLQEVVGVSQSLLSHHLRVLREAGLVRDRKDGRWVHYSVVPEAVAEVERFLTGVREDASRAVPGLSCCE